MDLESGNLPVDIVEHVLSYLPIPTIYRMRVVCKEWNKVTKSTTFHALCGKNGKNEDYLFLWRKDKLLATGHKSISPKFGEPFHFFDLEMERWYSIPSTQVQQTPSCSPNGEVVEWFLSMDNGLLNEMTPFYSAVESHTLSLSILDPIAKTSRGLPSPPLCIPPPAHDAATVDLSLVIAVDEVTHSYKVFFFDTSRNTPLVYMLESCTQAWREVGGLPQLVDDTIAFQNTAFASISKGESFEDSFKLRLFRYEEEGNTFAMAWHMNFLRRVVNSKLLVRHNRLFVLVTTQRRRHIRFFEADPGPATCFRTCQDEEGALFEMYEILLDEGSCKPVVQFTEHALLAVWRRDNCSNFRFAFPCFDSEGDYSSVVLMHHHSGEMRRFHLATGAVDVLPACPLSATIPATGDFTSSFDAKTMPLSFRDVLKHAPPTV